MDDERWLDDDEQRAWRALAAVLTRLPALLESQLQRDAGMSHFEYWVLALLSEATDRSLRLSTLAEMVNGSLSRVSHVVTRLERRGWVTRRPSPGDARGTLAVLTGVGWDTVVAAAPGHVALVRAAVFADRGPDDVRALEHVCRGLLEGIDACATDPSRER